MTRKLLTLLLTLTCSNAWADTPIVTHTATGATLSVIWNDGTKSDLVEGSGTNAYTYKATDAELVTDGLTAGMRQGRVYSGVNAASVTPASTLVGTINNFRWSGTAEIDDNEALLLTATSDKGSGTIGRALHNLRQYFGTSTAGVASVAGLQNAPAGGGGGGSPPRNKRKPSPAFTSKVSRRADGTYACTSKLRIVPGSVETIYYFIDMSPLFGPDCVVDEVGTPAISGGSLTVEEQDPRDQYAIIKVDGTATASEEREIAVPVSMDTGETVQVKLDVEVFGS